MSMLRRIRQLGQGVWLDFISREHLRTSQLARLVDEGVSGVTSNPTIFQKSIAAGVDYERDIRELAQRGLSALEIYETLAIADIQAAADVLRPVHEETRGEDGYVSLEVRPSLAHDTERTIDEARRLHRRVNRPNLMVKVPATPSGLPAITALIADGISVNVTLIFSIDVYRKVARAHLDGLARRRAAGLPLDAVASVASFFVSRVDTVVDNQLGEISRSSNRDTTSLLGQAAVANAQLAYAAFQTLYAPSQFADLAAQGARVQRPLWASTGVKNPAYAATKYIDDLIGPHTVNTMPPDTLDAARRMSNVRQTLPADSTGPTRIMRELAAAGINMPAVTDQLLSQGLELFSASFDQLMRDLEAHRRNSARSHAAAR